MSSCDRLLVFRADDCIFWWLNEIYLYNVLVVYALMLPMLLECINCYGGLAISKDGPYTDALLVFDACYALGIYTD